MESSSRRTFGGTFRLLLLGAGGFSLLLAGGASLWAARARGHERAGLVERVRRLGGTAPSRGGARAEVRRAGRATARGVKTGLTAAWDVTVGGADVARTVASVGPAIGRSMREVQASLSRAVAGMRHAFFSFLTSALWMVVWLSLGGAALVFIYLPESAQRERFFARVREMYGELRRRTGYGG